ncbi:hypothetical protein D9M68_356920 [compost metagenome]
MTVNEAVGDEEIVYRRIQNNSGCYLEVSGSLRLSKSAFNDPAQKPSVDRAALLGNDPARSQTQPDQGIVSLVVRDVRRISDVVTTDQNQNVITHHAVDVVADPVAGNPAHAQVVVHPLFGSKRPFDRLKESLARLASQRGWEIPPASER